MGNMENYVGKRVVGDVYLRTFPLDDFYSELKAFFACQAYLTLNI